MLIAAAALLFATASPLSLDELVKAAGAAEVASEAAFESRPCTVTIDARELDKKGAVKDASEIVMRRTLVDGKQHDELVRYVENGKDVTAEKKAKRAEREKEADEEEGNGKDRGQIRSPFHPKNADGYAFEDLGADKTDPTLRRIRFAPKKGATADDRMIGEATLTPAAQLRAMRMKPAKLPMLVSTIDIVGEFGPSGEVVKLGMKGEAGALFIKKRFDVMTTFDWSAAE